MDYKKYNDNELIYMVQENDENSTSLLEKKYSPLIYKLSLEYFNKYKGNVYELDDFYQEALSAFYKALYTYDNNRGVLFYTFVVVCIKRALASFGRVLFDNNNDNIDIEKVEYCFEDL